MKKRIKKVTLSRRKSARLALAVGLAKAIVASGKIKTTKSRAKFVQSYIEKLVNLAKKDTLAAKRRIFAEVRDKSVTKKLIREIGPKFVQQPSGFTRVINLPKRLGDAAPMALLEFAYPAGVPKGTKETKETLRQAQDKQNIKATKEAKEAKEVKNAK